MASNTPVVSPGTGEPIKPRPQWSKADWLDTIILCLLILTMCSQVNVRALGENTLAQGFHTKQLFVALSDVMLLGTFLWFVVRTTALRAWRRLWWPPFPCWALLLAMVISAMHSPTIVTAVAESLGEAHGLKAMIKAFLGKESKEAIAEIIQFTAYFAIAPLLFVNLLHDRRTGALVVRRRFAVEAFAFAVIITVGIGLWQRMHAESATPYGLFGSSNVYSGFLGFALPLLAVYVMHAWRNSPPFVLMRLAILIALLTMVSLWAVVALFIGVLIGGGLLRQPKRAALMAVVMAVVCGLVWLAPYRLATDQSAFKEAQNEAVAARHDFEQGVKHLEASRKQKDQEGISTAGAEMHVAQTTMADVTTNRAEFLRAASATEKVKKQYIEWYAAFGWSAPSKRTFATGVGPGNYQLNIGPYYGGLPNEEKMPPDSNNLYLVQSVSLGVLGLGALLWLLSYFASLARLAHRRFPDDWLGTGVLASVVAFLFVNLFHALIVRGVGLALAFILSLAVIAAQRDGSRDSVPDERPNAT
ncbi:MAG: hypothetical protein M3347_08105 [Armatimonadota bacterium]|nr:hypothetical protein [Armatimonadota bacterium]